MIYKNAFKKIKKSLGRYLSLLLIVFVGVGFYAGIQITAPDIQTVVNHYYEETELFDLKIVSTMGLVEADRIALQNLPYVESVIGTYSVDGVTSENIIRVHEISNDMNKITLKDGRMPKKANEVLADDAQYAVGDLIHLTDQEDILQETEFIVVGTIDSVLYISNDYGVTTKGNGKLNSFIFVLPSVFESEVYTEIYLTLSREQMNVLGISYEDAVSDIEQQIQGIKVTQETSRREEIITNGMEEIDKNQVRLDQEREDGLRQLNEAKETLEVNAQNIKNGQAELEQQQQILDQTILVKEKEFEIAYQKLDEAQQLLDASLQASNLTYDKLLQEITSLESLHQLLVNQLIEIPKDSPDYAVVEGQIELYQSQLEAMKSLQSNYDSLMEQQNALSQGEESFYQAIEQNQITLTEARQQLELGKQQLDKGYTEWDVNSNSFEAGIESAQAAIDQAIEDLNDLENPQWHVFNRENSGTYQELDASINVIASIAKVFPLFFILISILMTSNSMSRMIVEERGEIGTLTSMGYSDIKIMSTYLLYAISASLIGVLSGFYLGSYFIPQLIFTTFSDFRIPHIELLTSNSVLIASLVVSILSMSLVTIYACFKELHHYPATLLRPQAPRQGKGIFLERITWLWKRLSFNWKITLRNMFRYKKRAFMTIIGVGGCTALLLVGFGLRDSINGIAKVQFENIFKYDTMITLPDTSELTVKTLENELHQYGIEENLLLYQTSITLIRDGESIDAYLVIPQDEEMFEKYYGLFSVSDHSELKLSKGVIASEKLANVMMVNDDLSIDFYDSSYNMKTVKVSAVAENYISDYVYMSASEYQQLFNKEVTYNTMVVTRNDVEASTLTEHLLEKKLALNVTTDEDMMRSINEMSMSIDSIVLLIVFVASLLAFVVLYNLTSINISERTRELATLKVLGFRDHEANTYIYREAMMLTLLSIGIGLFAGKYLHAYVISVIEGPGLLFMKTIHSLSYGYAIAITLIFSWIMQVITYHVILKINMIEALKSVE